MEEMRSSSQRKLGRRASLKNALLRYFRSPRSQKKNKSNDNVLKSPRSQKKNKSNDNVLKTAHTIARVINDINVISHSTQEDDEIVRMKFLVREEGLEKVLELLRNHITATSATTTNRNSNKNKYYDDDENGIGDYDEVSETLSIDERLNLLRKLHKGQNSWSPALETIPEEIFAN